MSINPTRGGTPSQGNEFTIADPVGSFMSTVTGVVTAPAVFFNNIRKVGDFVSPLVFSLICYAIAGVLGGIVALIRGNGIGQALGTIIGTPIISTLFLFVVAGIIHLFVMLLVKPSSTGYESTYRATAYSLPISSLVSWVPFIGPFIGFAAFLYTIYLTIMGVRELHSTTTQSAALAVLIPVGILFLLLLCLFIVAASVLLAALGMNS